MGKPQCDEKMFVILPVRDQRDSLQMMPTVVPRNPICFSPKFHMRAEELTAGQKTGIGGGGKGRTTKNEHTAPPEKRGKEKGRTRTGERGPENHYREAQRETQKNHKSGRRNNTRCKGKATKGAREGH